MIKRYDPVVEYGNSYAHVDAVMDEWQDGEYVKYEDHLAIVKKLEERIAELESTIQRLEVRGEETYNKGYDDGRWAGYHELTQDFGVAELPDE